jgi:hypothetical protein
VGEWNKKASQAREKSDNRKSFSNKKGDPETFSPRGTGKPVPKCLGAFLFIPLQSLPFSVST